jgi:type I restriction enzyme R subunit
VELSRKSAGAPFEGQEADALEELALQLDSAIRAVRPDAWRGTPQKERVIQRKMYEILGDVEEVERIFLIVKQQKEDY